MDLATWATFAAASVALLLIPGPTVLMVLSYAIAQGRRVALATVAGVALGDFLAMTASLAGLGALVLASATLFTILKWAGALYLVWLGIGMIRGAPAARLGPLGDVEPAGAAQVFAHAATVTALNPKSIAFFIAFVPQFVTPEAPLVPQFAVLVSTFVGLAALNTLAWALLADGLRRRVATPALMPVLHRIGGGALIAMGLVTAFLRRPAT